MDTANGKAIGTVLWVSGCSHHCKGCHNPETWNACHGQPFTETTLKTLIDSLNYPYVQRLTLSGGDPLYEQNRVTIEAIVKRIKQALPEKKIWLYTGYLWEDITDLELLDYIDVLVDGKFIQELKDISLPFCGSTNQRIIDVQETLKQVQVILYKCD